MKVCSTSSVAAILTAECGVEATRVLVDAYGGQRIAIPKRGGGRLAEVLGSDIVRVLARYWGGTDLDIPSRGHSARVLASARLRADAARSEFSANEVAHRHGVTSAYVRKLRRQMLGETANSPKSRKA